ncbi:DUF6882 domain-containing protein [Actinomadura sp. 21ATH]|uniref:DUF6882 domain-containing protein n=1 Tax=Actinomadura sp. 21ATH TaxID=1735444 RepID=UPI0035BF9294
MLSEPLLALARKHNGWASEQAELFERLVPVGVTDADFGDGTATRSGITLRADLLGTFAADGTWLWAWGNDSFERGAGTVLCEELREFGESGGVPEFTERLLDFGGYPDPRLMAYRLTLICMGVLGGRGAIVYAHNARGRTFMITRDPAVPAARPRPAGLEGVLRGEGYVPGPAEELLRGYFGHHDLDVTYGNGRAEAVYPSGDRAVMTYDGGRLLGVEVIGPDGGPPVPESDGDPVLGVSETVQKVHADRLFPEELLGLAARCAAWSVRWRAGFAGYAEKELGGAVPEWAGGALRFPGGTLPGRLLGVHDLQAGTWRWADAAVTAAVTAEIGGEALRELEPELGLAPYARPEATVRHLAQVAAEVLGAGGVLEIEDGQRRRFVAVDGAWRPGPGDVGPDTLAADIDEAARDLHPLTPAAAREDTMYELAVWAIRRSGAVLNVAFFPERRWIGGRFGAYEVRAAFSPTGDIIDTGVHTAGRGGLP